MFEFRTDYKRGYVVEFKDSENDTHCESWVLFPAENLWHEGIRGFLYILCMIYFFVGIAIGSDIFMNAIECLTSKEREVSRWDNEKQEVVKFRVRIWNETVANLTLMALGSSAPEILLATIENILILAGGHTEEVKDSLGTFTIIGSAAFNLLVITSVCIVSVPKNNVKHIQEFGVFMTTAIWSLLAYVWMLVVVQFITPGVISPWEAWVTLAMMPIFVFMSYMQHIGWCGSLCKDNSVNDDQHMRILNQRGRAGSFTGHIIPGKELRVLEAEKHAHASRLSVVSLHSDIYRLKKNGRDDAESDTVIEMTENRGHMEDKERPSHNTAQPFTRASNVTENAGSTALAHATFRHAVVRSLTGQKPRGVPKKTMADVVQTAITLEKRKQEGKAPEGDLLGKFTFSSDRYAVLESAGFLEVDILFHRNIPTWLSYHKDRPEERKMDSEQAGAANAATSKNVPNGNAGLGNGKVLPNLDAVPGIVSIEYETREASARAGKDFRFIGDSLVFKESEYKKTISVPIINDNQFENDVTFYIVLKNPTGGAGIGDPSVATVTIVDDDEPGEFQFEQDHCMADLSAGKLNTKVTREHGFDGNVKIEYHTIDGTATGGENLAKNCDYVHQKGFLEFCHAETSKVLSIDINKNAKGPKNFIIVLKNPSLGAKIGTRSAIVCNITKDELGDRLADVVSEAEEETTWRGQFVSAMTVGGGSDDDGNDTDPTWFDYFMHFLTFFWKLMGACVPPTKYLGAWPTFCLSLLYIGLLVIVVEQLGHLIGCVIGLPTSITGITIIALGTSLPDTFASRSAAQQDENADAAVGNVTGSNCVNVFLGLGIPWVMSTMYHLAKGTEFRVQSDNLTQSVIVFSTVGAICIIVLLLRRKFVGGELGGKNPFVRWGTSIFLFLLWVLYIIIVSLKATDRLKWEV
ncbi:sodium/calcium exchanger 2-like isoform X3 [Mya arenaria]|uniref:sodium/calcium exchanger 2-like isoform X3 n=1 Tax=Mya arenaria TaxID=6604 RepID=UPI0022E505BB|nr:sodium/calcium exchanger 2-like isoform X3 [Mya arenaria]